MKGALRSTIQMLTVQAMCLGLKDPRKAIPMKDTTHSRDLSPLEATVMKLRPLTH